MQDMPQVQARQQSRLWQRLARIGLWPLVLAETCFLLICLGIGLVIWNDIDDRWQQEQRQELLRAQRLQASLIDQQLVGQQQHLRRLGRAAQRALQSGDPPASSGSVEFVPPLDGQLWLASSEGMVVFGEVASLSDERQLDLVRRLSSLESMMSDLYFGDALIERLYISLPQGVTALMPGARARADSGDAGLMPGRYVVEPADPGAPPLRWRTSPVEDASSHLALRLDVYGEHRELLAQASLELNSARLAQWLQEVTGLGNHAWLVDAQGMSLLGTKERILPAEAGRRGITWLDSGEDPPDLQVWAPLPITGWRLVSHLPPPETAGVSAALGWLSLGWGVGSLLILMVAMMMVHQHLLRWEHELITPGTRLMQLRQHLAALVPSWLDFPHGETDNASSRKDNPLFAHINDELDALEAMQSALTYQPRLVTLIEGLDRPALLTHSGRLVATNAALEQFVGRPRSELLGLCSDTLLAADADGGTTVRIQDDQGQWQLLRRAWSEDAQGHELSIFIDDSASRQRAQQLSLARDHAREESWLKTRYLALLRRELETLRSELGDDTPSDDPRLHERLTGLLELLDNLNGGTGHERP